jgi:hypothetical protein
MNKELELEAMDILKSKWSHLYMFGYPKRPFPTNYENDLNNVIIGLTSKYVEKQKLEFAIEQLNKLDSVLQSKIETLETVFGYYSDSKEYYRIRMSGVKLAKEEVRKDIKELEQQLKQYDKEI